YTLRSSADNYASDIVVGSISNNSAWTLKSHTGIAQTSSSATTFRLYAYNGTGSATAGTANWRIDDLKVTVSTGSSSTPAPVITVSGPATATAQESFTYQIQANNSPTSYGASGLPEGLSINTTTGVISGTPTTPGSYSVGLTASNATGDGTATLTINVQANPNAPVITSNLIVSGQIDTPFSYQIVASNSPTSYTAANLPAGLSINTSTGLISGTPTGGGTFNATITALNSFGSDSETLQISIRVPTLTLMPAVLNAFTANAGFTSATQSYTLTGSELTDGITVRAPQYFQISTDGVNFVGETTLSPAPNGTLSQGITVRVATNAPPGLTTGAISHTGSGATPKYLEVSATVSTSEPTLTLSATNLPAFTTVAGTASTIQTYEVSGASLTGMVTITPPAGFEIGASEGNFGDAIQLTPVNGALTATAIYVRLRADANAGSHGGNITHTGGGATAKNVAVSGTVTTPVGPNITATSGGSAYVNASYSFTIPTDGLQTVTSYGATGLPTGLSVNSSTGVISGTPTVAGTYNVTLRATSAQGTSSKAYTLRVITTSEQPGTPTVVVNKYNNATTDRVELLVVGDNLDGPPVDLRGMVIKDSNSNMATDGGGKYVFANHPLWANVKAGTLVVLAAGTTLSEDFDPSDYVLAVNLANATYFTQESGGFDIGNIDMVMIKPAGMQPDGVAGGMHVLAAASNPGSQYSAFTGRKTRARRDLSPTRGYYSFALNSNARLADFYATDGADVSTSKDFGAGNNSNNTTYINGLRNQDQDGPDITVLGTNPIEISRDSIYSDAGATAFDVGDNASKAVTTSGSVNTSTVGTYTLTYTATDSKGNIGTATRTVTVLAPASTPPTVVSSAANAITATTATLSGNVTAAGTATVTARGFLYSTANTSMTIGAAGVIDVSAGSGTGAFSAEVSGLSGGTLYYFRSYAINSAGTSYGDILSFTTLKPEPMQHAADFAAGTITTSNIPASWTPVQADGYLLVVSSGVQNTPTDGVPVANDTDVSDGTAAINLSGATGSYDSFTSFVIGETYTFRLYPYNNSGSAIDYRTIGAPSFTAGLLTIPELFISGNPAPLTTTYGAASSPTTFTVSGVYLTSTVSVSVPSGFEISADNTNYDSSVTLTPSSGTLPSTTIYLRLAATAAVSGSYNSQTITVSGGGAASVTATTAPSGNTVSAKALTVTGLSATDKVYDGTTEVVVVGTPAYNGLVNKESFPVSGTVAWAFADKNIGAGKVLARTGSFTAPSANYTIA
ncbi:MAG: putative Ig domain-containing protein, partial [Chthoniobacterales bacterium]